VSLRPRALPKARAQVIRHLTDLAGDGSPFMLPGDDDLVGAFLTDLKACDLYWVSEDMTALAMHAGTQLASGGLQTMERPSPVGLALFAGGLGMVDVARGRGMPVDALLWAPGPQQTLRVWHLIDGRSLFAAVPPEAIRLQPPPLIPIREIRIPVGNGSVPLDDLPPYEGMRPSRAIVAAMCAAWYLMQQPQLVDRDQQQPSRADARALARAKLPSAGVTVVDLRRLMVPQDRDPDAGSDGRHYRHRWVVSGHWRQQPYGRERSLRRQTWIPAHVKGPEGAPMLTSERVNVWRR
jgi:hypothetical protein